MGLDRSVALEVRGTRELLRNLRAVNSEYPREMRNIHLAVAEPVAALARSKVNSKSGTLASTIAARATQRVGRIAAGHRLRYGGPNHYGWKPGGTMRGQYAGNPFMVDAITEQQHKIREQYLKMTEDFLNTVWKSNVKVT